jgi:hypothetical protein
MQFDTAFVTVLLSDVCNQWRRQDLEVGDKHGERGARAYIGVWGETPRGVQAKPLIKGFGGEAPLKLRALTCF